MMKGRKRGQCQSEKRKKSRKLVGGISLYSFGNSVQKLRRRAKDIGVVANPFRTHVFVLPDNTFRDALKKIETSIGVPPSIISDDPQLMKERLAEIKYRRSFLAVGVREVTRALEQNDVDLVLYCSQVQPQRLISHLPRLAKLHNVNICALPKTSTPVILGKIMGCKKEPLGLGLSVDISKKKKTKIPTRNSSGFVTAIAIRKSCNDSLIIELCNYFSDLIKISE